MKLPRVRKLGWRIFYLHVFLALLGTTATVASVLAQESIPNKSATKRSPNSDNFGPSTPTKPDAYSPLPDAIHKKPDISGKRLIRAVPDTFAARQLVERLEAQESAAAAAAGEVRRLQANGDSVESIAPHQAQLKAHLQAAFELKMQFEELQVKELQSRLSRLERQIGQRKELREKIVERRADELISGDSLLWNTTSSNADQALANAYYSKTLPSANYLKDDVQYFPAGPEKKQANETAPSKKALNDATDSTSRALDRLEDNDAKRESSTFSKPDELRWRSGIVEIFAVPKIATSAEDQHIPIGSGVLVSSSGLVVSQVFDHPKDSTFLARFDDGSQFPLQIVEKPGSRLYVFQLPPGTRINHYFKVSGDQLTPSEEVYVFGKNISSPEHRLSLFTAQVAIMDRPFLHIRFHASPNDVIELSLCQLSRPDHYGTTESWPVLNANGELVGITLRGSSELLLVFPVEELKKIFSKTLGEPNTFPSAVAHENPSTTDARGKDEANSLRNAEIDSFQETWCFDALQSSAWPKPIGAPTDNTGRKSEQRWTIKGDRITWTSLDGELIEVRFTIDTSKIPKQIDFTFLSGPHKGMKSLGIYQSQKGNARYLWLCMTNPGTDAPRPTEVGYSSEKQQSMIGIYPIETPNTPSVPESLTRFQGMWQMTLCDSTLEAFGASQEVVKKWSWTIRGDEILWNRDGDVWKLKLEVKPSSSASEKSASEKSNSEKSNSELDLTYLTGPHKGSKCLGMFQWGGIDKSQLMIAVQDPGSDAPRPTTFSMRSDIKTGLMILEPRGSDR